jgi:hypothetical protein
MKRPVFLLSVLLLFVSCSKKDLNPPASQLILGKWKLMQVSIDDTTKTLFKNFENQNITYEFNANGFLTIHKDSQAGISEIYPYEIYRANYFDSDTLQNPSYFLNILRFKGKKYSVTFPWDVAHNRPAEAQLSDFYDHTVLLLKKE